MLTVKQHIDAYKKVIEQRRIVEAKQWKKYWNGKFKKHKHHITIKCSGQAGSAISQPTKTESLPATD